MGTYQGVWYMLIKRTANPALGVFKRLLVEPEKECVPVEAIRHVVVGADVRGVEAGEEEVVAT